MHNKSVIRGLSLLLIMIVAVTAGWVTAQDNKSLTEEETLSLLAATGLKVYPLEQVATEPLILDNVTATSAQLRLVTTLDTNCLVLYGETPEFGHAAQDADMGSGAVHSDHHPLLTGLKPETEYFYRVQGSDEFGNIYVSEIFSFRTPAEETVISDNLLHPANGARVIAVSSNWGDQPTEGSTWGAANAFDDNPNTAWSSNGDGSDAFVEVQLGQRSHITGLSFWTRTMSNDTAQIFSFTVTTDSGAVYGPFDLPDSDEAYTFDVDFEAETLRFNAVDSNGGNTGAVDIAAFGSPLN